MSDMHNLTVLSNNLQKASSTKGMRCGTILYSIVGRVHLHILHIYHNIIYIVHGGNAMAAMIIIGLK